MANIVTKFPIEDVLIQMLYPNDFILINKAIKELTKYISAIFMYYISEELVAL